VGAGPTWQVGGRDPPGRPVGGTYLAGQGTGPTWQASERDPPGRPVGGTHLSAQGRDPPGRPVGGTHLSAQGRDPPGRSWAAVVRTHLSAVCRTHLAGLVAGPTWQVMGGWCEGPTCQISAGPTCHLLVKVNGCVLLSMSPTC
jgi:hypothetical protein